MVAQSRYSLPISHCKTHVSREEYSDMESTTVTARHFVVSDSGHVKKGLINSIPCPTAPAIWPVRLVTRRE